MLFELAMALPELLAAASRGAVDAATSSHSQATAQPQGAGNNQVRVQDRPPLQPAKQEKRQVQRRQVVDETAESAMLQVGFALASQASFA